MNAHVNIGPSKSLRHLFLTRKNVMLFSMSYTRKQCCLANDWKLMQGIKVMSKRRRENVLLEEVGVGLFL